MNSDRSKYGCPSLHKLALSNLPAALAASGAHRHFSARLYLPSDIGADMPKSELSAQVDNDGLQHVTDALINGFR